MQNEQRSQPAGSPAAPGAEHARRDSDVVQAALRLHLKHFHAVEAAHAGAEEALGAADPAPPAAAERAGAHRARREAFGVRRGFLEQLAGFPASALATLSAADMQSLRIPGGVGSSALRTPLPLSPELPDESHGETGLPEVESSPETWTTAESAGPQYPFPEDDPDYPLDTGWELPATEGWELVPAGQDPQEDPGQAQDHEHAQNQHDGGAEAASPVSGGPDSEGPAPEAPEAGEDHEDHDRAPTEAGRSYLPEDRPDFKDLVSGRAEVPESSPRTRRTWMGLRRKGQRER